MRKYIRYSKLLDFGIGFTNSYTCKLNIVVNILLLGRDRPDVGLCWAVNGGGNPGLFQGD